ncbi:hypothetical protein BD408DRAFT_444752 [Parasitella parasitica]|nr:hypothetical protein BD408DRAFT_444752 [Parasitella parasitica]
MNIQFLLENGKGSVVDDSTASGEREKDRCNAGRKEGKSLTDKVRFFKLLFERCLSAAAAVKQLGIHVRTAQKWAAQYEKDPDSIFEKRRKTGRPRILHDEHKSAILECIDENPSIVLDEVLKKFKQIFTELKVSKTTLFDFVKTTLQFIS